MTEVTTESTHDLDVAPLLARTKALLGVDFVPRLFQNASSSPVSLLAVLDLMERLFGGGNISPTLKQTMLVSIATLRKNRYCASLHLAICKNLGMEQPDAERLAHGEAPSGLRAQWALVRFAGRVALSPTRLEPCDFEALSSAGFCAATITEAVTVAAFANMAITIAEALALDVEPEVEALLGDTRPSL